MTRTYNIWCSRSNLWPIQQARPEINLLSEIKGLIMTILIIEDDQRVSELIQRGLEGQGFAPTLAYNGFSGKKLALHLQNNYDLIITDIILPKMDGIDVCRQIRLSKPDIPIIMLTALGKTDDKVEGFDAGVDDYLVKPFEMRELLVRIRALLKRNNKAANSTGFVLRLPVKDFEYYSSKSGQVAFHRFCHFLYIALYYFVHSKFLQN